jgi:hypothetical protein
LDFSSNWNLKEKENEIKQTLNIQKKKKKIKTIAKKTKNNCFCHFHPLETFERMTERENNNRENKISGFQQKICFIKFLFFFFISTLHQAFISFSSHSLTSTLWQHKRQKKSFCFHNHKITSTLHTELSSPWTVLPLIL